MNPVEQLLQTRIAVLDGAMATMIPPSQRPRDGMPDVLNLRAPELIASIHAQYLEAGADIIETNTFNSNGVSMPDDAAGSLVYELNLAGAQLARRAAEAAMAADPSRPRFVAGCIGPTNRTASPGLYARLQPASFDALAAGYRKQVCGLMDGGVDLLLIETIFDSANAKAALQACANDFQRVGRRVPLMASVTLDDHGRILSGESLEGFRNAISGADILCVGVNCSRGARRMKPFVEELSRMWPVYTSCHPSAGLPNGLGEYEQGPAETAAILHEFAANGWINIAGGCCGTTPAHIRAAADAVRGLAPRPLKTT